MEPNYLPYAERRPNRMYRNSLRHILKRGEYSKNPFQTMGRYAVLTLPPMVFKFSNGFPLMTERKIGFWRKPIGELLGFIHGVRDARELADKWGVSWWRDQWATPEKCGNFDLAPYDLGLGSYGGAFQYTTPDGGTWNQFREVMQQVRDYPDVITHKITSWIPHYAIGYKGRQRKVVVAPCHGDIEITVMNGKLYLRMDQRSADFPIGVPSNTVQYAALTIMLGHVLGYTPYMFIHATHNSHIYEDQIDNVKEIMRRETRRYPSVHLTEEGKQISDLFDFRPDHFELRDYDPLPAIPGIPVTT